MGLATLASCYLDIRFLDIRFLNLRFHGVNPSGIEMPYSNEFQPLPRRVARMALPILTSCVLAMIAMTWSGLSSAANRETAVGGTGQQATRTLVTRPVGYRSAANAIADQDPQQESADLKKKESRFLTNVKQRTSAGLRSGEGYFGADGTQMVFQSERSPDNPFYQIYLMDFELGDVNRISPGHGKTTCAWIHPNGELVMYASTQDDPLALDKQKAKIKEREEGKESRYNWDYDEMYELFSYNVNTRAYTRLTNALGYDAEGSYSPNGSRIAFASNRRAYVEGELSDRERQQFEFHRASVMDIYIMDADGGNVTRLTDEEGYDGGPFFSADGTRICWRRFKTDMTSAEIWTMSVDGTDKRRLTDIKETSFAPFFHPSGDYIVFMSNIEGYSNFELYMIPTARRAEPVRVTFTDSFDGFPTFSPDGKTFSWTSNRSAGKSQIFTADWNHQAALNAIGKAATSEQTGLVANESQAQELGAEAVGATSEKFVPEDVLRHVDYLCRPELGGRMTGSIGERKATAYVAAYLDSLGFQPDGDLDPETGNPTWYQEFVFPAGARLGKENTLAISKIETTEVPLNDHWRPLTFSESGIVEGPLVFAGYGMKAPKTDDLAEYDSFVHLPVEGKWVMVFRYMPENVPVKWRQQRALQSQLRVKASLVRDMGGLGLIIVSGPNSNAKHQVIPLARDSALGKISIPVISISDEIAQEIMKSAGQDLTYWQNQLDSGDPQIGFEFPDVQIKSNVDVQQIHGKGRNVIGRLQFGDDPVQPAVIVGAHIDHLGNGSSGSLARAEEIGQTHYGADDNASGVAAMLEVAQFLSFQKRKGKLKQGRDLVIAAWSGEELGLHGSNHFVDQYLEKNGQEIEMEEGTRRSIQNQFAAYLNMDMVGRFDGKLVMQGLGSSDFWAEEIEKRNIAVGLALQTQMDTNLPTDASEFYRAGVPILAAFTGSHSDYHTPRDTPDKLNYDKAAEIAKLMGLIARSLIVADNIPEYKVYSGEQSAQRMAFRVSLGTSPDYTAEVTGVQIKSIRTNSASHKAGVKPQDIVVKLAGISIENVYDYTNVIAALKPGETVKIVVERNGERVEMDITPE